MVDGKTAQGSENDGTFPFQLCRGAGRELCANESIRQSYG